MGVIGMKIDSIITETHNTGLLNVVLQALFVENFRGVILPETFRALPELEWVSPE
jgi:hypothetical protein